MSSGFYRAFEDRHRGSRELILGRLEVYLPFIETLKAWHTPCTALDLGCGRGEWLQLLQNNGVQARGVDLDEGMLDACRELGLPVRHQDAIEALKAQPDNSLALVTAFHLVEHIEFSQLQELVSEALRVLQPGGLLILETPNAENLMVGTNNFYLDPTHIRPVPGTLLSFVTELAGFARNKIMRLQEDPVLHQLQRPGLQHVLGGVSPDYAVIAQKPADADAMSEFDEVFAHEYGISLAQIASRYDRAMDAETEAIRQRLLELAEQEENLRHSLEEAGQHAAELERSQQQMQQEQHHAQLRAVQLETLTEQLRQQLLQATQRGLHDEARARAAESRLLEASTRAAQLEARYEVAHNHQQQLAEQQQQLSAELLGHVRHNHELQLQLEQATSEISVLKSQMAEREVQLQEQGDALSQATAALEQSTKRLEQAAGEISVLKSQMAEREAQLQELDGELQTRTHALKQAEAVLQGLELELAQASDQIATQKTEAEARSLEQDEHIRHLQQQGQEYSARLEELQSTSQYWQQQAETLQQQFDQTRTELDAVHQSNHHHWSQLQERTQQLNDTHAQAHKWQLRAEAAEQRVSDLLVSTSWRITAPLRGLKHLVVWLLALPFRAIKALLRPVLSRAIRFALNRPALRQRWANRLRKYPKVFAHLRQFAINRGLVVEPPMPTPPMPTLASVQVSAPVQTPATPVATAAEQAQPATNESPNLDALTPRAKQIYHDLKAAIEKNKEHQ